LKPPVGRGVAVSDFSYWSGYRTSATAAVIELRLDDEGWFKVERAVVVIDCGIVINPDVVRAQIEGSIAWALSNAMYSEITLTKGAVNETNFNSYRIMRINEMPVVETYILDSPLPPAGVGEDAIPVTIGALVNAIHAAGGPRTRSLPLHRLRPLKRWA
jgi:isoquinoline 1-oxidoreductase subunit beta